MRHLGPALSLLSLGSREEEETLDRSSGNSESEKGNRGRGGEEFQGLSFHCWPGAGTAPSPGGHLLGVRTFALPVVRSSRSRNGVSDD